MEKKKVKKPVTGKQIAAMAGIILILAMYIIAFVSSLFASEVANTLMMAAIACTFIVPVMLYAFLLVGKSLKPSKSPLIDNIIFDIGDVLVEIPWDEHCRACGATDDQMERVFPSDFFQAIWRRSDLGLCSLEELKQGLINHFPDDAEMLEKFMDGVADTLVPYPYAMSWIRGLKNAGYNIYILSNWSDWLYDTFEKKGYWEFLKYTDGAVFSQQVHEAKPDAVIYERILKTYDLDPHRTLYLDDRTDNIEAGAAFGLNTITFTNYEDAKEKMNSLGIKW
ncbi:MAG: HAD family phosphatase [Lachnospiraceae bacterium]|nr:HAD family phosphatase [Candidatus Equihabitans merdae]